MCQLRNKAVKTAVVVDFGEFNVCLAAFKTLAMVCWEGACQLQEALWMNVAEL